MQSHIGQGVLDGVRVLEVGGEIGAWCGKLLGDVGADVIKVEPPTGDPTRSYEPFYENEPGPNRSLFFWHYNTSKRSVTLDLEHDRGREVFKRLVARADVVVDSNPAGHLGAMGHRLSESICSRSLRRVVMVSITPFGQSGPYSDYQSTDLDCAGVRRSCVELRIRRPPRSLRSGEGAIRRTT